MHLSPDEIIWWSFGVISLNSTILYTWIVMAILAVGSWLVTRRLSTDVRISRWQHLLEVVVDGMRRQIMEISRREP